MRILLLGATGRTGQHLLRESLQRGWLVHALVRDKNKIAVSSPGLVLFEGSPADPAVLNQAMKGCEAIASALNISRYSDWPWSRLRTPADFLSSVMMNIIELAPANAVSRVIFTSAWGVAETRRDIPAWFRWFIENSNIRFPYEDHAMQESLVKQTGLAWTAVRAAGLTNFGSKKPVIVSFNNVPKPRLTISRGQLATFMLDILEKKLYIRQAPVVSA
jgi:uncharacterized protein YbjT (DUF2867 family)